jgi:hypothetical protein
VMLFLAVSGLSQNKSSDNDSVANEAGIEVVKFKWGYPSLCCDQLRAFDVQIKNNTTKTIVYVQWDYVFTDTVRWYQTDRLHFITDDKPIKPGETRKLKKELEYSDQPSYVRPSVEIIAVRFSDGSSWNRPKATR